MVEFKVTGMTCDGCANSVKRAIVRASPKANVQVELTTGLVRVEGELELAEAETLIKEAGFGFAGRVP
jgi:copper chaperone